MTSIFCRNCFPFLVYQKQNTFLKHTKPKQKNKCPTFSYRSETCRVQRPLFFVVQSIPQPETANS